MLKKPLFLLTLIHIISIQSMTIESFDVVCNNNVEVSQVSKKAIMQSGVFRDIINDCSDINKIPFPRDAKQFLLLAPLLELLANNDPTLEKTLTNHSFGKLIQLKELANYLRIEKETQDKRELDFSKLLDKAFFKKGLMPKYYEFCILNPKYANAITAEALIWGLKNATANIIHPFNIGLLANNQLTKMEWKVIDYRNTDETIEERSAIFLKNNFCTFIIDSQNLIIIDPLNLTMCLITDFSWDDDICKKGILLCNQADVVGVIQCPTKAIPANWQSNGGEGISPILITHWAYGMSHRIQIIKQTANPKKNIILSSFGGSIFNPYVEHKSYEIGANNLVICTFTHLIENKIFIPLIHQIFNPLIEQYAKLRGISPRCELSQAAITPEQLVFINQVINACNNKQELICVHRSQRQVYYSLPNFYQKLVRPHIKIGIADYFFKPSFSYLPRLTTPGKFALGSILASTLAYKLYQKFA